MLQKCCQKSWQNFWKTVIIGNICQIWHHQATLHMRRLSSNELCEHFDGVLFFIQSLLHLILAYKKLKSFSHKHSRFVFNQTHISWWRPNPPCLTKDLKYGYDALFKQSLRHIAISLWNIFITCTCVMETSISIVTYLYSDHWRS